MKFKSTTEVRQFGHVQLVCVPRIMQELLDILMKLNGSNQKPDAKCQAQAGFCYMFKSGAKLRWMGKNNYGIYCYSYNATDGLSAAEELKVAYALREAAAHFVKMKVHMGDVFSTRGQVTSLKHSIEWVPESPMKV